MPKESLQSFPEAFRVGMAARAEQLLDRGESDPKNWDQMFGSGQIHIAISIFSDTEEKWRHTMEVARRQHQGMTGINVLGIQDFGGQPGDRNPLGYKDGIGQPAIEGSGIDPLPGQGRPIKAGEFILGYPGEAGVPLAMPKPDVLGRNGTFLGLRKYQSRVGAFNRFLRDNAQTEEERELLAAKLVGRWRSGAPLTLAPTKDEPALGQNPLRNDDFTYANDPNGEQAPLGCHMRRMNPRDTKMPVLTDVNIHRIIRRSTTFGTPYDPNMFLDRDEKFRAGSISSSSAPKRWRPWNSCSASGSIAGISWRWATNVTPSSDCRTGGNVHYSQKAGQAPSPRDPDVQCAARRRVFLHAESVGAEMVSGSQRLMPDLGYHKDEIIMDKILYDRGLAKRRQVLGASYVDRALSNVNDFNREFQRLVTEYCWGEVWGEDTLSPRERSILTLGMVAALGKMGEFANHVRGAGVNGLTPKELARCSSKSPSTAGFRSAPTAFRWQRAF